MAEYSDPSTPTVEESSLAARVAHSAAWIMGAGIFARFLGAINTIIVARLLVPEDIGIVAVATITMQLLQGVSDIGISQAVVKFQKAGREDLDTLFTLSALRGLLIAGLLIAAAPVAGAIFHDPRMTGVFVGIAAFPVITGLINPKFFEFERDLKFSREFISTVLNKLVGVLVSVSVALAFRTYWAIILGLIAGGVTQLFLSYFMRPHLPRISFKSFGKVFGFSSWLTGVGFLAALNNKLDVPIIARLAGSGGAGSYFMGFQLSEMVTGQIALPMTRAIYPGLAVMQNDPKRMQAAFLQGVAALGAIAMPAAVGLSFVASDFVAVVLGGQWGTVAPIIQILAPVIGVQSLFMATQSYAVSLGRTRLVFFRELFFLVVRLPVFIWAAINYGLMGAVWAAAGLGGFHIVLNLALYARLSGGFALDPLIAARRSIGAVLLMAVYFVFARPLIEFPDAVPTIFFLGFDILTGAIVYTAIHFGLWRLEGRPDGVERRALQFAGR